MAEDTKKPLRIVAGERSPPTTLAISLGCSIPSSATRSPRPRC